MTVTVALSLLMTGSVATPGLALAESYVPISGAGSTWAQNSIEQWRKNVNQYGLRVNYAGTGATDGRNQFRDGTVDFAVSEIPYGRTEAGIADTPPSRPFAYMPIVAGGLSFMYNLTISGERVTQLRLSGDTLARIFTGVITDWSDPRIVAENPGLALPARRITPVIRGDGSGTTMQVTEWMAAEHTALWDAYCVRVGRAFAGYHCASSSFFPSLAGSGIVPQAGSLGVSGYVAQAQNEGAITYVESSYVRNAGFSSTKVLNRAGYYVAPTPENVAVALLGAAVKDGLSAGDPLHLTQDLTGVYANPDARAYPLSNYTYLVLPTAEAGTFDSARGKSLGAFAYYFLCEGQQQAPRLGFAPLPINLVQAGLEQVMRIPGVDPLTIDITKCNNPTFSADGTNTLVLTAPFPQSCDRIGQRQCMGGASLTPLVSVSLAKGLISSSEQVTASVSVVSDSGNPVTAGRVRIQIDGAGYGNEMALDSNGNAVTRLIVPSLGLHVITAAFSGATVAGVDWAEATSAPESLEVVASPSPSGVKAVPGDRSAVVSWTSPTGPEPVIGYRVTVSPGASTCETNVATSSNPLSCTVKGLTNGVAFTFSVVAQTNAGNSPPTTIGPEFPGCSSSDGSMLVGYSNPQVATMMRQILDAAGINSVRVGTWLNPADDQGAIGAMAGQWYTDGDGFVQQALPAPCQPAFVTSVG